MTASRDLARWEVVAAADFTRVLEAPRLAGEGSTRVYRDIKGWICNLVHHMHALRWAALSKAIRDAVDAADAASIDAAVCAVTRAIIEHVVVRQPDESRRIVTSNARRQCARKKGRLSLIRLVDLALALSELRVALAPYHHDDMDVAHKFWRLVECLRALRAVHDMDSTARSIDLSLLDPCWATEHACNDAFHLDSFHHPMHTVDHMRAAKTDKSIRYAVFRASRMESDVDCPPKSLPILGLSIVTAAIVSDFDPCRALAIADSCVNLTGEEIWRIQNGTWPIPITLKEYRLTMFCEAVLRNVAETGRAYYMAKLAQLFVPVGWHVGGIDNPAGNKWLEAKRKEGNFCAYAALGRRLARSGYTAEGFDYLQSANRMGDVAAPIVLGDLYRDAEPHQARDYYNTAMSRGSALAALNLGIMYLENKFSDHIVDGGKKAAELFQCSVDRGNKLAAYRLARILHDGAPGQPPDVDKAVLYYTEARNDSTVPIVRVKACMELASIFEEGRRLQDAANELYRIVGMHFVTALDTDIDLKLCVANAVCTLARHLRDLGATGKPAAVGGKDLTPMDLRQSACSYYRLSAELAANLDATIAGKAWYGLGMLYFEINNLAAALDGFRNAMNTGHKHAPHNLGNLLLKTGRVHEALDAFEEGARRGDSAAANNAAQLTVQLKGYCAAAQRWYERAMELGSTAAPANLAKLLMQGREKVVPGDLMRAKELLAIRRQRGQSDGMEELIKTIDELAVYGKTAGSGPADNGAIVEDTMHVVPEKMLDALDSPKDVMDKTYCDQDAIMTPALGEEILSSEPLVKKDRIADSAIPIVSRKRASRTPVVRTRKHVRQGVEDQKSTLSGLPDVPVSHPWGKLDVQSWTRQAIDPLHAFTWREMTERGHGVSATIVVAHIVGSNCRVREEISRATSAIVDAARAVLRGKCILGSLYKWRVKFIPRHFAFAELLAVQIFSLQYRYFPISPLLILEKVGAGQTEMKGEVQTKRNEWVAMER